MCPRSTPPLQRRYGFQSVPTLRGRTETCSRHHELIFGIEVGLVHQKRGKKSRKVYSVYLVRTDPAKWGYIELPTFFWGLLWRQNSKKWKTKKNAWGYCPPLLACQISARYRQPFSRYDGAKTSKKAIFSPKTAFFAIFFPGYLQNETWLELEILHRQTSTQYLGREKVPKGVRCVLMVVILVQFWSCRFWREVAHPRFWTARPNVAILSM